MFGAEQVYIIAEAGVNHNGDLNLAYKLIDVACEAGADAVKFQTFIPEQLATVSAVKAEYQKQTTDTAESQQRMLKQLALSKQDHLDLINYCKQKDIQFASSPFDLQSIDFLDSLNLPFFKIPSGEIINLPYMRRIAGKLRPVIFSTGMANLAECLEALQVLLAGGMTREQISILHCTTQYPTNYNDVNLKAMHTLRQATGCKIGFSDHTPGIEASIAAVALGAQIIEKHFTLDKSLSGPDHKASLDPAELKQMIQAIRNVEAALGDGLKEPRDVEQQIASIARKAIVAACPIAEHEPFSAENLTCKRTGSGGISPMLWDKLMKLKANRSYQTDEIIDII